MLFEQLPPESATRTAIRNSIPEEQLERKGQQYDATKGSWSSTEMLLALIVDHLATLSWMYASANSKGKVPKPNPVPRPGIKARHGRVMTIEEIKAIDPRLRDLDDDEAMERYREMTGRG